MGKGDQRSKRGKIFRGTHGNTRRRAKEKAKKKRRAAGKTDAVESGQSAAT
ncbi:MAG: 30S ribosomal protein THX [Gemmatimonadales bacterium]